MEPKERKQLNGEERRQLMLAQHNLETGKWSFWRYSVHLSLYVFGVS